MKRALVVLGLLAGLWASVANGVASASTWSPAAAATPAAGVSEAGAGSTCSPSGYPGGRYFVVFVYGSGEKRYCSYGDEQTWLDGATNGDIRGITGGYGYTSIYVRDAGTNTEVSAHFTCYSAGHPCTVATDTVSPGPATVNWSFNYTTACKGSSGNSGHSNEAQALRYTFQNLYGYETGQFTGVFLIHDNTTNFEIITHC